MRSEIRNGRFVIAGGTAGQRVSWQLTGVRSDPWVKRHGAPVEELKPQRERGTYLHPHLYGQPEAKSASARLRL